jgi:hypothetical protein
MGNSRQKRWWLYGAITATATYGAYAARVLGWW